MGFQIKRVQNNGAPIASNVFGKLIRQYNHIQSRCQLFALLILLLNEKRNRCIAIYAQIVIVHGI